MLDSSSGARCSPQVPLSPCWCHRCRVPGHRRPVRSGRRPGRVLGARPPLSSEQVASADAQSSADAADAAAVEALEERAAAADAARALAAEQAAKQAAAAARAERRRQAALEQASRDALRDPRGVAEALVAAKGWSSEQFSCLDRLWTKESNWRVDADNPSSSAYGIPQALPGSKMSSFGADWRTNPVTQIKWGLNYIDDSYGTPCSAWSHSRSHNWF